MLWFRSNIRIGSWCALVALALQLALTYGHVHAHVLLRDNASGLISVPAGDAPADLSGAPVAPARRTGLADFCAICANIDMANALLLADPPGSLLRLATHEPLRGSVAGFALTATRPGLFNARAPPLA